MLNNRKIINFSFLSFHLSSLLVATTLICVGCETPPPTSSSLEFNFGSCLGELNQQSSCSSQLFLPLTKGEIACWILSSSSVDPSSNEQFRTTMSWNGESLNLSQALDLESFPFEPNSLVNMQLLLFDSLETARLCSTLNPDESCQNIPGCLAKLKRANTPLSFNEPIGFQNGFGECLVETPSIRSSEFCADQTDNDCDGVVDEGSCVSLTNCDEGAIEYCNNFCGRGERICTNGRFSECSAPSPSMEVCSEAGTLEDQKVDEDCDGVIDEGCATQECSGNETRPCQTTCGAGISVCINGNFVGCDGPQPQMEVCDDQDNDCDGAVDEGLDTLGLCVADCSRQGTLSCLSGSEICLPNNPNAEEVCNSIDEDCDGQIDEDCICLNQTEECDGKDNDCDGAIDEDTILNDACGATRQGCAGIVPGFYVCSPNTPPQCLADQSSFYQGDEICDLIDNDCDGMIDEDLSNIESCQAACTPPENQLMCTAECSREGVSQCLNGMITCTAIGEPTPDICDGQDNDCDGNTDEGVLNACGACGPVPVETCNGQDDDCDNNIDEGLLNACGTCGQVPVETCNGRDDDCDNRIDEGVQNACGTCGQVPMETCNGQDDDCDNSVDEGVLNACGDCGQVPVETCNGQDDDCDGNTDEGLQNACGDCGQVPLETCNGQDDDCDGNTDEEACSQLLYDHCEARLGWQYINRNNVVDQFPSTTWPSNASNSDDACPSNDDLDTNIYSCDVSKASAPGFQAINIGRDPVSDRHWLGISWYCNNNSTSNNNEYRFIEWAQSHCHIALAYKDVGGIYAFGNLESDSSCSTSSEEPNNQTPRCIVTQGSLYSGIELQGTVNTDDVFGIAFYCEDNDIPDHIDESFIDHIHNEFQIFFGVNQRPDIIGDGSLTWDSLPNPSIFTDNNGPIRGVGSLSNGEFNAFKLSTYLDTGHQFSIKTHLR